MGLPATSNFFSDQEREEFLKNQQQPKQEYSEPEDIEDQEEIGEGSTDLEDRIPDSYYWTAWLALSLLDDTRALMASAISGRDKERYLQYTNISIEQNGAQVPNREDPVLGATAYVFRKWNFSHGPEVVLILSLVLTSAAVILQVRGDRREDLKAQQQQMQQQSQQMKVEKL